MHYQLAPGILTVDLDDETVLLNHMTGHYFGLRGAIRSVIDLLEQGADEGELVERIALRHGVSPDVAGADLAKILPGLLAAGLLVSGTPDLTA